MTDTHYTTLHQKMLEVLEVSSTRKCARSYCRIKEISYFKGIQKKTLLDIRYEGHRLAIYYNLGLPMNTNTCIIISTTD